MSWHRRRYPRLRGFGVHVPRAAMPLISEGLPAYANDTYSGAFPASNAVDSDEHSIWEANGTPSSGSPAWLALDLSTVADADKTDCYLQWYQTSMHYQYVWYGSSAQNLISDYSLRAHSGAGSGAPPSDGDAGWVTLTTVTGNPYNTSSFRLDLSGYNWVELHVTATIGPGAGFQDAAAQLTLSNAAAGSSEAFLVIGDSATDAAFHLDPKRVTADPASVNLPVQRQVQAVKAGHLPIIHNASIPGWTAAQWLSDAGAGTSYADLVLARFPGDWVIIALGGNEANGGGAPLTNYQGNMQALIDKAQALGKKVIIPHFHHALTAAVESNGPTVNGIIDGLVNGLSVLAGPDMWTLFDGHVHPDWIDVDNLHPTDPTGYNNYRTIWANWLLANVY